MNVEGLMHALGIDSTLDRAVDELVATATRLWAIAHPEQAVDIAGADYATSANTLLHRIERVVITTLADEVDG